MTMACKINSFTRLSNLLSRLDSFYCHPHQIPLSLPGLRVGSTSIRNVSTAHSRFQAPSPLLGVSLQNLPGNRCRVASPSTLSFRTKQTGPADSKISWNLGAAGIESVDDFTPLSDEQLQEAITFQINDTLENGREGRLYAVVHVRSLQYKVTAGDIIIVKHDFPPSVGDRVRLEKVLAVGGSDFTLFGQPLLGRDKVFVDATVVEETLSHNRVWLVYRRKRNFQKFHLYREHHTMLLINSVRVATMDDNKQIKGAAEA